MTDPEELLQHAAAADVAADAALDPSVQIQFRKLAEQWRLMAQLAMNLPIYAIDQVQSPEPLAEPAPVQRLDDERP